MACLCSAPKPALDVATELGLSTRSVVRTLSRLVERGAVSVLESQRFERASRPLAVYRLAPPITLLEM